MDVRLLLGVHELVGGTDPGRRGPALQVLNRSGIVLVCAIWEAYCEDLVAEALHDLVTHVSRPNKLPKSLRKLVATEIRNNKHELAPWDLAGEVWKTHLEKRLDTLERERNRGLNTPKAGNIDSLFFALWSLAVGAGQLSRRLGALGGV